MNVTAQIFKHGIQNLNSASAQLVNTLTHGTQNAYGMSLVTTLRPQKLFSIVKKPTTSRTNMEIVKNGLVKPSERESMTSLLKWTLLPVSGNQPTYQWTRPLPLLSTGKMRKLIDSMKLDKHKETRSLRNRTPIMKPRKPWEEHKKHSVQPKEPCLRTPMPPWLLIFKSH